MRASSPGPEPLARPRRSRRLEAFGFALLCSTFLVLSASTALATTYKVDPEHTSVNFTVRHLFTRVHGRFDKFEGTIIFDPKHPEQAKVWGSIEAASVNTNEPKRDKDLRSNHFFDVKKFPKITFKSTAVTDIDRRTKTAKVHGFLTIHGVRRPVVLDATYLGAGKDPWGNEKAGFSATLTINRKDYGLTWNEVLETGGVLVGDLVSIELDVEGIVAK